MAIPKKPACKRLKSVAVAMKRSSPGGHNNSHPSTSGVRPILQGTLSSEERAELEQLAQLVPVPSSRTAAADPCAVLHAAASYIDQLRATVAARVKNGTLPRDALVKIFQMEQPTVKRTRPAPAAVTKRR